MFQIYLSKKLQYKIKMKKQQMSIISIRNKHSRQVRKNKLEEMFRQHRIDMSKSNQLNNQIQFNNIYPNINQNNFQQHLTFILKYCFDDKYNYRLTIFAPYLYQYLIQHYQDFNALQIIQELTQFQEFQIPQTEVFVDILLYNLTQYSKNILVIIYNLLSHPKYSSLLKEMLIDKNFVEKGAMTLTKHEQLVFEHIHDKNVIVYFNVLCLMVTTHPLVKTTVFEYILRQIGIFSMKQEYLPFLFQRLSALCCTLQPNNQNAKIIYQLLEDILLRQYFSFQQQTIDVLHYCLRSDVKLSDQFTQLVIKSLLNPSPYLQQSILQVLKLLYHSKSQVASFFKEFNIISLLLDRFSSSSQQVQASIMKFMSNIIFDYLLETFKNNAMINQNDHLEHIPRIIESINIGVDKQNVQIKTSTLQILFELISALQHTPEEIFHSISSKIQQQNLLVRISQMKRTSKEMQSLIQQIVKKYQQLQSQNGLI